MGRKEVILPIAYDFGDFPYHDEDFSGPPADRAPNQDEGLIVPVEAKTQ
jgi:hypothetical protein